MHRPRYQKEFRRLFARLKREPMAPQYIAILCATARPRTPPRRREPPRHRVIWR